MSRFDFVSMQVLITKRAHDELKRYAAEHGRTVEDLAEAAIEDACMRTEPLGKPKPPQLKGSL